jgi:hypothetical protein
MNIQRICMGAALGTLFVQPAQAGDSLVDRWANRTVEGTFSSEKSSLALEYCIATQLPFPTVIHGENITEIDSLWAQLGVRIKESDGLRVITYVANPRINDHTAATIRGCL